MCGTTCSTCTCSLLQKSLSAESSGTITTRPPQSPIAPSKPDFLPFEEETLSLADFVKQYGQSLPLKVRVEEGFCGNEER